MNYCFIVEKKKNKIKSLDGLKFYLERHPELLDEVPAGAFYRPPPREYGALATRVMMNRGDGVLLRYEVPRLRPGMRKGAPGGGPAAQAP